MGVGGGQGKAVRLHHYNIRLPFIQRRTITDKSFFLTDCDDNEDLMRIMIIISNEAAMKLVIGKMNEAHEANCEIQ